MFADFDVYRSRCMETKLPKCIVKVVQITVGSLASLILTKARLQRRQLNETVALVACSRARSVQALVIAVQLTVSTKTATPHLQASHGLYRVCSGAELSRALFCFCVLVEIPTHKDFGGRRNFSTDNREQNKFTMCGAVNLENVESEGQNSAASSPGSIKGSLSFILDDEGSSGKRTASSAYLDEKDEPTATRPKVSSNSISSLLAPIASVLDENEARTATRTASIERKGSKYCIVEGCVSRAKHARRCWKHGGSVKCKVAGCRNRAKTKGVCWSHGGGTSCSADQCTTIAVSNGVCWAHGGGKRCVTPGCSRPAYERTRNMCSMHYNAGLSTI